MKRWHFIPRQGETVNDPVIRTVAEEPDPGSEPARREIYGRTIITYSRTRLYFDRNAWDALPAKGVLVLRIRPRKQKAFALALTKWEMETCFGEVCQTKSWERHRCYHFAMLPPAAEAFRVPEKQAERPRTEASCLASTSF